MNEQPDLHLTATNQQGPTRVLLFGGARDFDADLSFGQTVCADTRELEIPPICGVASDEPPAKMMRVDDSVH
jgi:hypothetical protein